MLIVAAAALIAVDGHVLLQQRPANGPMPMLWEFPGGKLESGETPEVALVRELNEELGIDVEQAMLKPLSFASEADTHRSLLLLLYMCRQWQGTPKPLHASALRWVKPADMHSFAMPPADQPLVAALIRALALTE
jgi:8-oxo-dGTP diphosphatase